uniref:Kelch repeat-containing protein n=1 Tax=Bacillus sonorensis TaxID=119858 RepID=UPI000989CB39|nr:PQQ-binding-like beta-propeller repeat protein [Bacillus sonorensis]
MPNIRSSSSTAVVDGKIYIFGGFDARTRTSFPTYVYDPKTAPSMPKPIGSGTSAAVIGKKIYVIGGLDYTGDIYKNAKNNYCYDTETETWTKKQNIPVSSLKFATAVVDGKIYAIGGRNDAGSPPTQSHLINGTIYMYDPRTDTWTLKKDMQNLKLEGTSATVLNGKIYIIGGNVSDGQGTTSTQVYNPSDNSIKDFKPLKNARTNASTVTIGNNLYVIGGAKDRNRASPLKSVEMYTLDESTPETPTTPESTPDQSSGDRALLVITMTNGLEKEFDLSMDEVNDFISWYDQKDAGSGSSKYAIDKHDNNKGPFSSRKDYVIFNNILTFEVNEYSSK